MRNHTLSQPGSWCRRVGWLAASAWFSCAIALFLSWYDDEMVLRQEAMAITENLHTDSARIRAVNNWVYHNKGFAPNDRHFILPQLGPTPIQVMEQGGDCSNKSRLVAAMLNSLGIDAGLVMISPCLYCPFIHTVVEARYEAGRMVVDPTWDVDYPTGDGRFLGVTDLAGTNRGQERVAELRHQRPATDKIWNMPPSEATFENAVAMNWDRNLVTRSVAATLQLMGYRPGELFRPRLLEDPKLFLIYLLVFLATILMFASLLLGRGVKVIIKSSTVSASPHI